MYTRKRSPVGQVLHLSSWVPAILLGWAAALMGVFPAKAAPGAELQTWLVRAPVGNDALLFDGSVEPIRQAQVAAQAGGRILSLGVRAGDRVRTGQILATVDDREAQAALERAQAQAREADAALRRIQADHTRSTQLRREQFISQAALDNSTAQLNAAQAAREQVDAALAQARLGLGYARITAPFDAVVREVLAEAGDLAVPGRPILTLYAPQALRVLVRVSASSLSLVRQSKQVEVQAPDGGWIRPLRTQLMPVADAVSQTIEWRLDLPVQGAEWLPGQQVRVRVDARADEAARTGAGASSGAVGTSDARWVVPRSAVVQRGELSAVYVAGETGFSMRAVRLGRDRGAQGVEIVAGLREGERVAVDGLRASMPQARPAP